MADGDIPFYYPSSMTLNELQDTCNTDEFTTTGKLQSLDTVLNSGAKNTEAIYKKTDLTKIGQLVLDTYVDDADADAKKAASPDDFLFKGKAFLSTVASNILVFRKK